MSVQSRKRLHGRRVSSNSDDDSWLRNVRGNENSVAEFRHRSKETSQLSHEEYGCSQPSDENSYPDFEVDLIGARDEDLVFTSDEVNDESEEHIDDHNAKDSSSTHENEHEAAENNHIEKYSNPGNFPTEDNNTSDASARDDDKECTNNGKFNELRSGFSLAYLEPS
ncbi:unnamed protein product [Allacma fusca]|uniref:Uncharacterized protein n=1 Tax=Allacma fusca TaxID=39272 RepID=A0A8J2PI81_9HEXA|nr:unnamed protein product [Allacma fusca]